jgi:transposase-like protein
LDEREGKDQEGSQSLLRDLTKEVIEALYEGELTDNLGYENHKQGRNSDGIVRNGRGKKTVQSKLGEVELSSTPGPSRNI